MPENSEQAKQHKAKRRDKLSKQLEDVQSYAILTEEIGAGRTARSATPGMPGGTSALGQVVDSALREVLGWRPRVTDAQGFVAALNQSFTPVESDGLSRLKWTPRSYAVAAEMGAITGAQASIYTRAKAMLDQSSPLLLGLTPLNPAFDHEDTEAIRAIVQSSLTELVSELGRQGGPRVDRVDELFFQLFGTKDDPGDPEALDGQLGLLRRRFGLERDFVNTIGEEQNLTNYLILADNTIALRHTWEQQKKFFQLGATDVFLGTQLVLLSRALAVVAESVEEVYFAMDSVFLGPAERQVTELHFPDSDLAPIFVGDLLSWVESFATNEGPRVIREGGKDGVIVAFRQTAEKLSELLDATAALAKNGSSNPTPAFHTSRVQRALIDLAAQLDTTVELADQIKREPQSTPYISQVRPEQPLITDRGAKAKELRLILFGADFRPGIAVRLLSAPSDTEGIPAREVSVRNGQVLAATFDNALITPGVRYLIEVINRDGGRGRIEDAWYLPPALPAATVSQQVRQQPAKKAAAKSAKAGSKESTDKA